MAVRRVVDGPLRGLKGDDDQIDPMIERFNATHGDEHYTLGTDGNYHYDASPSPLNVFGAIPGAAKAHNGFHDLQRSVNRYSVASFSRASAIRRAAIRRLHRIK